MEVSRVFCCLKAIGVFRGLGFRVQGLGFTGVGVLLRPQNPAHTKSRKHHAPGPTFNKRPFFAKHLSDACFTSFSVNKISSSVNKISIAAPDFKGPIP